MLTIRQIRSLLYDQGFTIGGARQKMDGDNLQVTKSGDADFDPMIANMIKELEIVLELLKMAKQRQG